MTDKLKGMFIAAAAIAALALGGAAIAGATGNDQPPAQPVAAVAAAERDEASGHDDDATEKPITGQALEQAKQAALAHTNGGEVTDTEVGDEESKYEVEVTKADGSQVDVQLDEQFNVVGTEADSDEAEDRS